MNEQIYQMEAKRIVLPQFIIGGIGENQDGPLKETVYFKLIKKYWKTFYIGVGLNKLDPVELKGAF